VTPPPIVEVADDAEALAWRVAGFVAARASRASERFGLGLSGGSTPKRAYEVLADFDASLDWRKIHFFWGDERFVPPDHRDSNFRMAREALIDHVPIPAAQVHPIPTVSGSPEQVAALYEATLQDFYGSKMLDPERPLFDVALLGLGEDGSHRFAVSWNQGARRARRLGDIDHWGKARAAHRAHLSGASIEQGNPVCRVGPKKAGHSRARSRQRHDATRRSPRNARNHPHFRRPRGDRRVNVLGREPAFCRFRGPCYFVALLIKRGFEPPG
jgi:Glucosamine-6-phosphate isomerases/6-phosphogluconolactonase